MRTERDRWKIPRASALLVAAALVATMGSMALASPTLGLTVKAHGDCSGPSEWTLSLHASPASLLTVKYSVKGGRSGQRWNVFVDDNGRGVFAGSRTSGTKGAFSVSVSVANLLGRDKISVASNDTATGETCHARAGA
jgi:hypothetical protein